jgi:hypothetical protein
VEIGTTRQGPFVRRPSQAKAPHSATAWRAKELLIKRYRREQALAAQQLGWRMDGNPLKYDGIAMTRLPL